MREVLKSQMKFGEVAIGDIEFDIRSSGLLFLSLQREHSMTKLRSSLQRGSSRQNLRLCLTAVNSRIPSHWST